MMANWRVTARPTRHLGAFSSRGGVTASKSRDTKKAKTKHSAPTHATPRVLTMGSILIINSNLKLGMTLDTAWERWDRKPTRANLKQVMKAALKEPEEPQSHIEKLKELLVKIKRPDPK